MTGSFSFSLTDATGDVVAFFTDFMGCNEDGDWLTSPGYTAPND